MAGQRKREAAYAVRWQDHADTEQRRGWLDTLLWRMSEPAMTRRCDLRRFVNVVALRVGGSGRHDAMAHAATRL
ncbi:MAG: hypothetical protein A3H97_22830 [Acidobacteria bacterium RIFCSPLOWO2_02_FULL_65_29]|nr:MAG: hypothetical protein A3H97_22830 [Acidobacteria bacterium RIFCSPLOWO2_02_FULL_65_29]